MIAANGRSPLLEQLGSLCEQYPYAPKFIIVPRSQLGRAVEDALARRAGGWAGIDSLIPRHYAEKLARSRLLAAGRTELPVEGKPFLVARILRNLEQDGGLSGLPGPHRVASTVSEAIDTLRLGGISLEEVHRRAQSSEASESFRTVAACYEQYVETLQHEDLYDDADLFEWATRCVRDGDAPGARQSVVAVCDATDLPEQVYRFLRALQVECQDFFRIGAVDLEDPPSQSAAARFGEIQPPSGVDPFEPASGETQFCRAVGAYNEVKAVFRDLLSSEEPLDEVEIAYAEATPYLSLIADRADRMGVSVSISTGLPATRTRPGQALQSFYEWIGESFDASILIRMLRSGHLRLDRVYSSFEEGPILDEHEAATLLASRRYEPGRRGCPEALDAAIRRKEDRIQELEEKELDTGDVQQERDRLVVLCKVVEKLIELVPRRASVQEMARTSRRFLERFGPVDKPPEDKPEEERTLDEAARTVLWQKLDALTRLPLEVEASGRRLAALLGQWLDRQYVRAENPRAGAAHVVPLEGAGYGGRSHLYVVGLDSDTLSTTGAENGMLREADRRALSRAVEAELPDAQTAPDESMWRVVRALERQSGALSLYTRTFDIESGEERYPSSLYLQLEGLRGGEQSSSNGQSKKARSQPVGFRPRSTEIILSDAEAWLNSYRSDGGSSSKTAREALREEHPWIRHGERARRALRSEDYTTHDGLLEDGPYPELDFFHEEYRGGPLSAARLETLAETPYLYFLKYVLGIEALDEPALDDEPWLNPLRRGTILHGTFEKFMTSLDGEAPTLDHESQLREKLRTKIEEEVEKVAPPSTVVKEAARRQLIQDARLFLRAEVEHADDHDPLWHERGFGFGPYRRRDGDFDVARLDVGENELLLRGRIDRIDRRADGDLALWDYKTGSSSSFDEETPLKDGAQMQWALYACALEEITGERVAASGYFFTSVDEMGARLSFKPHLYRDELDRCIQQLREMARTGSFPMTPDAEEKGGWKWQGYDRLFLDLDERCGDLKAKEYPEDRPVPPTFDK